MDREEDEEPDEEVEHILQPPRSRRVIAKRSSVRVPLDQDAMPSRRGSSRREDGESEVGVQVWCRGGVKSHLFFDF